MTEEEIQFAYVTNNIQPLTEAYFLNSNQWSALIQGTQITIYQETLHQYFVNDDPEPHLFTIRGLAMDLTELGTEIDIT